jgi:DNA polymerase III subunit delta
MPLFGGRRAVWVKPTARNLAPAVEALIASSSPDCRVVIEAGELRRNAPLRVLCERAKNAVTLPCYPDGEKELVRLIDDEMRDNGMSISREARDALVPLLGGDRLASRHELRKLGLFAAGKARVELKDVIAVVADASALAVDDLIDAAFAGRPGELEQQFAKARTAGTLPGTIMSATLRQVAQLHKARLSIENGAGIPAALEAVAPYVPFERKKAIEAALRTWTSSRLERAMTQLADAALETRRQSTLANVIAHRALLSLAVAARTKQ